ncbi:MAG: hypothetical protein CK530_04735 [Planctomycetaceae bacterium]|nr:MAG: hypothetical protein CK530_10890 [Planctomycetaceae bacterium]PHY02648.1 MAG: hypothetical protein CK530_04735 [Planctomycetaceae bacterium]
MRLTLRTLLAWLDNLLPPPQQKQLSEKVAASPVAAELVERIRRIGELASLSAPRPDGRGLGDDANSVAEYLDNILLPERLEAFERVCIESDLHLAEVTACHTILADVARDPQAAAAFLIPLDEAGRGQLLKAINRRVAATVAGEQRHALKTSARELRMAVSGDSTAQPRGEPVLGDAILFDPLQPITPAKARRLSPRQSSRGAWMLAIVALLLLVILGAVFVWSINFSEPRSRAVPLPNANAQPSDQANEQADLGETQGETATGSDSHEPTNHPAEGVDQIPKPVNIEVDPVASAARAAEEQQAAEPVPSPPVTVEEVALELRPSKTPINDSPVMEIPLRDETVAVPLATTLPGIDDALPPTVPLGDALAIAAPAAGIAAAVTAPADRAAPPAARFVGVESMLLHRIQGNDGPQWVPLIADEVLGIREDLLVPPGFYPDLTVSGSVIRFLPGTRAALSFDADSTPRIEIIFGRAIVRVTQATRMGIIAAGVCGTVTSGLTHPVAIYVELDRVAGSIPAEDSASVRAGIIATTGGFVWQQSPASGQSAQVGGGLLTGIKAESKLEAGSAIEWNGHKPAVARVSRLQELPDWTGSAPRRDYREKEACDALFQKAAQTPPLLKALQEMALDRKVENRLAAVQTLSLVGEYDDLVKLLCDDTPQDKLRDQQWVTLEQATVPLALCRGAHAAAKLKKAIQAHAPPGKPDILFAMACGFSDSDLLDGADRRLVDALEDSELVVRRYAIKCLNEIAAPSDVDRLRYQPDHSPESRRTGASWWRSQVEKGLVRRPIGGATALQADPSRGAFD